MVLPPVKLDHGEYQFDHLQNLYNQAVHSLKDLCKSHPEHSLVWKNVKFRLKNIQNTFTDRVLPTTKLKKETELGTMLRYECPDMAGTGELVTLYELDNAYQRLGIKPLTELELDEFCKNMGCKI